MPAAVFTIEDAQFALAVVDREAVGYTDDWQAPEGATVDTVVVADYEMPAGSEWRCQVTSGVLTASPNISTRDVPATWCGPGRSIPVASETSYALDLEWLQDPQIAEGLSRFLFEHDTEEAYFYIGLDGSNPPKAIGRVRLVAGSFGGAAQENLTSSVSLEVTRKPQIMFGTTGDSAIIPPNNP